MSIKATTIPEKSLFIPRGLEGLTVKYKNNNFCVIDSKGLKSHIQRADLDKELRGISNETLQKMLDVGYLNIRKIGKTYTINYNQRLNGGGPFGAIVAYVATNVAGGAMMIGGGLLTATGVGAPAGVALLGAGTATIAAAPAVLIVALPAPTP